MNEIPAKTIVDPDGTTDVESAQAKVTVIEPEAAETTTTSPFRVRSELRTLKRGVLAILVLFIISVFYIAQEVLIPIVLALLLALLLSPVVTALERFVRLPRALGSLLTVSTLVGVMIYAVASLDQPAQTWIAHAPQTMNRIQLRLRSLREPIRKAQEASKKIEELTRTQTSSSKTVVNQEPG